MGTWPATLRATVATMVTCPEPMHVTWGPQLTQLYNDAYIPVLGPAKHPAMGESVRDSFAESWDTVVGPRYAIPLEQGRAYSAASLLLPVDRHGWMEEAHFAGSYSPLRDQDGTVVGVLTVCTETTLHVVGHRRVELLAELATALAHPTDVPDLFDVAVDVLTTSQDAAAAAVVDLDGTVVSASGLDLDRGDVVDVAVLDGVDHLGRVRVTDLGLQADAHPAWPAAVEHLCAAAIGDHWLLLGLHPGLWFDDAHQQFVTLVADALRGGLLRVRRLIDARDRVERLQRVDRLKDALLSDVSHELRTPLMLIAGSHDQLRRRLDLSDDDREMLWATAGRSIDRLERQVDTLLSYGRLAAGHLAPQPGPVDLAVLTADIVQTFVPEFRRVDLDLRVEVPADPVPAEVDAHLWETVLFNLLTNAHRFTLRGGVEVRVDAVDDRAVVEVTDTGVGIPEDELDRLFERFHRVRGRPARTDEGAGIGLALVAGIVGKHDGTIDVTSTVDVGTTFRIRLPLLDRPLPDRAPSALPTAFDAPSETVTTGSRRGRILLVDDNDDLRRLVRLALEPDWDVEVAANGREAQDRLVDTPVDILVTDAMMPELDGEGLIASVRADPATSNLPIVLLTGRGEREHVAGADAVLAKPFPLAELSAAIEASVRARAVPGAV